MVKAMAAAAYRDLEDFEKAYAYLKESYLVIAVNHGEENLAAGNILNSMGVLYKKWGKHDRA